MNSYSINTLERKKEDINRTAMNVAFLYINDIRLRSSFIRSEGELANVYINDFKLGRISYSDAIAKLHEQYKILNDRYFDLVSGKAKIYAIAKIKRENSVKKIILSQVGFVSGVLQTIGGYGICSVSLGAACASIGTPLVLHGLENASENIHYLLFREESSYIPLRDAYRYAAVKLGGTERDGDIAYSTVDLTLSGVTLFRSVLKPDAWKLFHYIREDYIIGWKTLGVAGITSEFVGNSATGFSIYQIIDNNNENNSDENEQWNRLLER
ncbi:DUF4225 domain-containing protein [Yersinia aldovae]|uniref:DUF4225 domain-containing protein n=1 Tax=Yersinia aldovae TaxID=29483 RepID=UPI0005AD0551|nr:DUF4225 domain-containing protein [Yersinia aldovae]AJJ64773.1 hypothetical protein AT01_717 [Yersinia aldovae 670-83]